MTRATRRTTAGLVLLVLTTTAASCTGSGADHASVAMHGATLRFEPGSVTIPVGGSVTWENDGRHTHAVAAADGAEQGDAPQGGFSSGEIIGTGSFSHTFDEAGVYLYVCTIHEEQGMQGIVEVVG